MRAERTLARKLVADGVHGVRQLVGQDSGVVRGCRARGRSRSRALGGMMRSFAGELLMADIQLGPLPLPSKQNPSDDPSRRRAVRRLPVPDVPRWAAQFVAGDVHGLDSTCPR